ncbi:hypothetical protein HN807_01515 [Candidatus Bathyarchaeota archaeon]|nr:hypothetical protein [Candidatus Bathyarchaeota archaeon]MBT4320012.1 hypothetical protein [Candidatus Bathyarchaeota archaeon]MBT4423847.1 hypothetical protein [Candidatus Bathyarchaeota archaeon]MBT6603675.1 hypothetical protein [Candidatus Bathyarchaeota archaeon]MBT7186409.1 hypothetical protein [Candidatus Bathyarchaeota archaeon]
MTNTLHRKGSVEELKGDYVIFTSIAKDYKPGSAPKIHEFLRICNKYGPVNIGSSKLGSVLQDDVDFNDLVIKLKDGSTSAAVFTDVDTLQKVVSDLVEADLGISINISGLLEGAHECCGKSGIQRHSLEQSLGFWGAKDRLPEREVIEITTLCGHGMVSFNLIRKMMEYVRMRRLTPKKAATIMGKCCECAVFNTDRAERILEKVLEQGEG